MADGPTGALAALIARRPGRVLLVVLAVTLLACWPLGRLRIDSRLEHLIPEGLPGSGEYRDFLETFGGLERIFVLVVAAPGVETDPDQLSIAADAVAASLRNSPHVVQARSGLEPEDERFFLRFVLRRAALFIDGNAPDRLARAIDEGSIRRRVEEIRDLVTGPAAPAHRRLVTHDPLGLGEPLMRGRAGTRGLPLDPVTLSFLSDDEDAALVLVTPASSAIDPEGGRAVLAELERAYAQAREAVDMPIDFVAAGGPLYAAYDERALREDLQSTGLGTGIAVALILIVGFGSLAVPVATLLSVALGLVWTAGLVGATFGSISAVGVGLVAILVGLGDDYGIHGASRFRDLSTAGCVPRDALLRTLRGVGPGVLASAATTAAAFSVLALAEFRFLREVGIIVAMGMLATLAALLFGGASFLVVLARRPSRLRTATPWRGMTMGVRQTAGFCARHPKPVLALAGLLTMAATWTTMTLTLDANPRLLRPTNHPGYEAEARLADAFELGFDISTVVIRAADLDGALGIADRVTRLLRAAVGTAGSVDSPSDWLLDRARIEDRLSEISRAGLDTAVARLEGQLAAAGFEPAAFSPGLDALRALAAGRDPGPPTRADWPAWLAESIRVEPHAVAIALHVRVPEEAWPDGPPDGLMEAVREIAPGASFASVGRMGVELRAAALDDLSRLGAIALGIVMLIALASFAGNLRCTVLACLPVILGSLWIFGLWGALGRPLDLFCLGALPIMLGIGIDDGLHAVHGARREHEGDIVKGTVAAGRAIVLTSLTTSVGFASLLASRVPALRNGGLLVALGVLACLVATLTVLPALATLGHRE